MSQLDTIYVLCGNKSKHKKWAKNWIKIKGVHTNIKEICEALQLAIKQRDQDTIAVSFLTVNEMTSTDNLNQLEPTFMYTQIFKEILLDMGHDNQAISDFITYSRRNNSGSSININRFEKEYHSQSAIRWYTLTPFIYCMLNDVLRSMEVNTIINMGFFIRDLHQQIQRLYQQQITKYHQKPFIVYRGQGLSKENFEKLQKSEGGLISFNNFLSTSTEKDISLVFARSASEKVDMVGIVFKMLIDPRIKSVPFAFITEVSSFDGEDEVLFSMHTVFRVGAIQQMDNNNQLYQVELKLTSDDDQQLRLLTDWIREEAAGITGWQRLGHLLLKIGQFNQAEELYNALLKQASDESEKALYYNQLGGVHFNQGNYEKAARYFEQGLEICQKALPSKHSHLATSCNNIGSVYKKMGEYSKALLFYEKDFEICQKTLPSDHPKLATSCNNIGSVYKKMGDYSKALLFYGKTLEICQKTLPPNHPHFAISCNNIGLVYDNMSEYSKALSYLERALNIWQRALPPTHPDIKSVKQIIMLRLLLLVCLAHLVVGRTITGNIVLKSNPGKTIVLPNGCQYIVQVVDASLADGKATELGTTQYTLVSSLPQSYTVTYVPSGLPMGSDSLQAQIKCPNGHMYINDHRISVPDKEGDNITIDIGVISHH
ncbi:unnamed protein product [Adineta steineri]|uniref:ADP ribosyltransferase domain-containing protein n=2 Tax=Adineta steineri TaxID=433720 RepID=A0A819IMZ5_9BILA|nr:unnamed protein product [Adineta steineri]